MNISDFIGKLINKCLNLNLNDITTYGIWCIAAIAVFTIFLIIKHFHNHKKDKEQNKKIEQNTFPKSDIPVFSLKKFWFCFFLIWLIILAVIGFAHHSCNQLPLLFIDLRITTEWLIFSIVISIAITTFLFFDSLYDGLISLIKIYTQNKVEKNKENEKENILWKFINDLAFKISSHKRFYKTTFAFIIFSFFAAFISRTFPKEYSEINKMLEYLNFDKWAPFFLALLIAIAPWTTDLKISIIFKKIWNTITSISNILLKNNENSGDNYNNLKFLDVFIIKFLNCFILPFKCFITITFFKTAVIYFPNNLLSYDGWFRTLIHVLIQLTAYWFLWRIADKKMGVINPIFTKCNFGDLADSYCSIVSPIFKILIFIFGGTFILQEIGIDMSVAFKTLSIGSTLVGAAMAWVSSSTLSNMISGMVLIMDKPFSKGDWVIIGDIEGEVESISFRCTKIRKFSQELVEIPNSKVAERPITNVNSIEKRKMRRVEASFNIDYFVDPDNFIKAMDKIKQELINYRKPFIDEFNKLAEKDKDIEEYLKQEPRVYFSEFQDFAAKINVVLYIPITKYAIFLKCKNDINIKIIKILAEFKIKIAVPVLKKSEINVTNN